MLHVITTDADIKSKIGQVHKISKRSKNALLTQILTENQERKLM